MGDCNEELKNAPCEAVPRDWHAEYYEMCKANDRLHQRLDRANLMLEILADEVMRERSK